MPRERAVGTNHGGSTGLLSSVFSFVSREIDSFVSTATGRPPREEEEYEDEEDYEDDEEDEQAQVSSSHAVSPGRKLKLSEHVIEDKTRHRNREQRFEKRSTSQLRSRSQRRESDASDSGDDHRKKARRVGPSPSTTLRPRRRRPAPSIEDEEELATSDGSHPPVKPSPSHIRRKRSHFTMPGALYDRTSSLEPTPEPEDGRTRHVRFASEVTESPSPRRQADTLRSVRCDSETGAGPSSGRRTPSSAGRRAQNQTNAESSSEDEMMPSSPIKRVPRPRRNSFVQEAIRQRSVERNPDVSLLLPKSRIAVYSSPSKGKGKEKAPAPEIISISDSEEGYSSDAEWNRSNQADLSVRTRVKGKEKELRTVRQRESTGVDDEERRRDKERIRVLEEELRKLREELAKRPVAPQAYSVPPPPPPPPPPRPSVVSRPQAAEPTSAFAQARASLRRAGTPVEKPINPAYGAPSLRKGQPTINLGVDKMAAFLNELKTHRLRRVGFPEGESSSVLQPSRSQPAVRVREVGDVGNRSEFVFRPREIEDIGNRSEVLLRPNRSFAVPAEREHRRTEYAVSLDEEPTETAVRNGEKRKHVETSNDFTQGPLLAKRRALATSFHTADTSGESLANESVSSRNSGLLVPPGRRDHPNAPSNIVQSRAIRPASDTSSSSRTSSGIRAETDITTPSLSSDNEQDNGSNESQEGRLPPTPPPEGSTSFVVQNKGANSGISNVHDAGEVEEIDVEMYRPEQQHSRTQSISRQQQSPEVADTFSRRAPASPRLLDSPLRPRPPARPRHIKEVSVAVDDDDMDGDPLSMSYGSVDTHSFNLSQMDESRVERDHQTNSRLGLPVRPPPGMFKPPKKTNLRSRLPVRKGVQKNKPANASAPARGQGNISISSVSTATQRRESLDSELRRAEMEAEAEAAYDAEISHEDVQLESGTFGGRGTRGRKQGFLAFGGAGGPPAVMGDGSIEGLEHFEDEEYEREVELPARRLVRRV